MEECVISGKFPPDFPYVSARYMLRRLSYESLDEFKCAPSEGQISTMLNDRFTGEDLTEEVSIRVVLTPEEALNTASSVSMASYTSVSKKRKLSKTDKKYLKRCSNKMSSEHTSVRDCSVCLYSITKDCCEIKCGCIFHSKCLRKALKFSNKCPVCSSEVCF